MRLGLRSAGEAVLGAGIEAVFAGLACLLLAGVLALGAYGLTVAPRSTAALLAAVVVFTAYGVQRWLGVDTGRGLLARLAVGWSVFVAVWLTYVLQYCDCV